MAFPCSCYPLEARVACRFCGARQAGRKNIFDVSMHLAGSGSMFVQALNAARTRGWLFLDLLHRD